MRFIPDRKKLEYLNNEAIRFGFNQIINPGVITVNLEETKRFPILLVMPIGIVQVRAEIVLEKGETVYLDMTWAEYEALPRL